MIESVNNERIKNYSKLNDKKYRIKDKLFLAIGEHLVREALSHGIVKEILLLNGEDNTYGDVTYVNEDILKKVSLLANAPKVLAICNMINSSEIKGNVIILDNIKDPGNLGTIIRCAVAFNYESIILSDDCVDVYNPKVVRSAEGMLFNTNIIIGNVISNINSLKEMGYKIYGTNVNGGVSPFKENDKHALIIGSESKGMDPRYNSFCDKMLYIPMNEKCESLNAGVSASILMYELGSK